MSSSVSPDTSNPFMPTAFSAESTTRAQNPSQKDKKTTAIEFAFISLLSGTLSGLTAGGGAVLFAGRKFFNITFIASNVSFAKAFLIAGGAVSLAVAVFLAVPTLYEYATGHELVGRAGDKWNIVIFAPLIAIPYIASASIPIISSISLIGLGILGCLAVFKAMT